MMASPQKRPSWSRASCATGVRIFSRPASMSIEFVMRVVACVSQSVTSSAIAAGSIRCWLSRFRQPIRGRIETNRGAAMPYGGNDWLAAPYRFTDPARFSFAHGGKDRHPFPVPLRVYDQTIQVLKSAVQKAKLGCAEELGALKRLDDQARQLERHASGPPVQELIAQERQRSPSYGSRSVFGWEHGRPSAKIGNVDRR